MDEGSISAMKDVRIASWSNVLPTRTLLVDCDDRVLKGLDRLEGPFIPRGSGRSFGDAAYVTNGAALSSRPWRTISAFDPDRGTIVCASGVQMVDLFGVLDRSGWSFPIAGGTQWVTIGGAVAADIHGKNDVAQGSFGNHVESIQLVTSDGQEMECSRTVAPDLFAATIGGMGLTGFITHVTLKLQKAESRLVHVRTSPFAHIEEMRERFDSNASDFQVAWLDLTTRAPRGIYYEATYVPGRAGAIDKPIDIRLPRIKLFNWPVVKVLNAVRYAQQRHIDKTIHVRNFEYPVDILKHWNKFYGRRGFQEYQFVVSPAQMFVAFAEFLRSYRRYGLTPFFAVVKKFGTMAREGLLSFPKAGFTLMADFESRPENQTFFTYFTDFLLELNGQIYLAKDSYMLKRQFECMYDHVEQWRAIVRRHDPTNRVRSDLSTRLGMKPW